MTRISSFAPRMFRATSTMLAAGLILAGCESSGLSIREGGAHNVSNYILALSVPEPATAPVAGEPAATTAARPAPLRPPIRLAVAQVGEVAAPQAFVKRLRERPELFDRLDILPAAAAGGPGYYAPREPGKDPQAEARAQIEMLCRTAEKLGDDYLFIFGGNIDQATLRNGLSVLNLTIVGGFFVPSREVRAEAKATGALVDLKTRQVIELVTAQSQDTRLAAAFTDDAARLKTAQRLRDRLAEDLATELINKLNLARDRTASAE
ncbi:hypothetical protein [Fontivita pretiosa]|uniref:hypothetical protein n=1 Tax=Fontivita pretiosa TaxID=2989684 RepID=UPI003D17F82E